MFEVFEDEDDVEVISSNEFSMSIIEQSVINKMNIIDTLVSYCEDKELDMYEIIPLLDQSLIERIKICGIENRYVVCQKKQGKKLF